jgi:hypothetical protein
MNEEDAVTFSCIGVIYYHNAMKSFKTSDNSCDGDNDNEGEVLLLRGPTYYSGFEDFLERGPSSKLALRGGYGAARLAL